MIFSSERPLAGKRLGAAAYLEQWGPRMFPAYFGGALHPFFTALLPLDADERVAALLAAFPQLQLIMEPSAGAAAAAAAGAPGKLPALDGSRGLAGEAAGSGGQGAGSLGQQALDRSAAELGAQLSSVAGPAMQARAA